MWATRNSSRRVPVKVLALGSGVRHSVMTLWCVTSVAAKPGGMKSGFAGLPVARSPCTL